MKKRKVERGGFGVRITEEEEKLRSKVCRGCPREAFCHKYIIPKICKAIKEDIAKMPITGHTHIPEKSVRIVRVLTGYKRSVEPKKYPPIEIRYKYSRITSIDGFVISIEPATEGEWIKYEEEEKKKRSKPFPPISECPPANPWR